METKVSEKQKFQSEFMVGRKRTPITMKAENKPRLGLAVATAAEWLYMCYRNHYGFIQTLAGAMLEG